MSLTESDKTVLTKYPIAPSKCVICLRGSDGELNFIDFQMSLDVYGSVNICVECLAPVAQLLGFVEKSFLNDADLQIRNLVETNRELQENNVRLNATLDSLLAMRPNLTVDHLSSDESAVEDSGNDANQLTIDIEI
jgi:hypothetical protein